MERIVIDVVAGARPNFMKIAALFAAAEDFPQLQLRFIHTGQHYDPDMSTVFLKEFGLPQPVHCLEVGSASHGIQTAEIMRRYEMWVNDNRPDICLVVGDVNSTIACALVAAKVGIKVAHVESGLRSFDRSMPEEINRVLTDSISRWHFVTEPSGIKNLKNEGLKISSIYLVGNVMIDTLLKMKPKAEVLHAYRQWKLEPRQYAYLTLHRPSNVDAAEILSVIIDEILWAAERIPVIFPVHPRTRKRITEASLDKKLAAAPQLHLTEPLGYLPSLSIMLNAKCVITDSGGIQEETTALGVPCLTLRENTERPITIQKGTNVLIGNNWKLFRQSIQRLEKSRFPAKTRKIPFWDGQAGRRILQILARS